ncbi:spermidine/putrescine ABC transporter substrate-binding protein [Deltaproteobacteria bacterium]|nr:spermidine/putrescine ABC transporter substrate-binding protein [Deltaproteobacteria bacterium]
MKNFFTLLLAALLLAAAAPAPAKGPLTVFIWSEYMDPSVVKDFEKETGLKVRFDYYESNEEMIAKLQSGGVRQYDLIFPSAYFLPSLKSLKLIQPLDRRRLSNLANLDPAFADQADNPDFQFAVPYQWGTSGLAARGGAGPQPPDTWGLLFQPQVGSFIIFDTARDALGSALKYLGYSLNSTDPQEIQAAIDLLAAAKARPTFFGFDGGVGGLNKVMSGLAAVAQVYSGEAIRAHEEDEAVRYILPREGFEVWLDLVAIPTEAPNLEAAYAFIDYMLRAEVGAQLATYNRYATPNAAARAFLPSEDLANPAMYPPPEVMERAEYMKDLGPGNRLYDEAWTLIKNK